MWSIVHTSAYFVNIFRAGRVLHSMASHTWPFVNMAGSIQAHIGHQQHEEEKVFLVKIKMIKIELMTRSYISKTVLLDASNNNRSVASHREAIALVLSIYW